MLKQLERYPTTIVDNLQEEKTIEQETMPITDENIDFSNVFGLADNSVNTNPEFNRAQDSSVDTYGNTSENSEI